MNNKMYDIINKLQRWIPSLGMFYLTISAIWSLPFGDQVNQTIAAIATLMAAFLEVENAQWSKTNTIRIESFKNEN